MFLYHKIYINYSFTSQLHLLVNPEKDLKKTNELTHSILHRFALKLDINVNLSVNKLIN